MNSSDNNNKVKDFTKTAREMITLWSKKTSHKAQLVSVEALAFDVSARRYYRVTLKNTPVKTLIIMQLAPGDGPLGGGPKGLPQSDTFIEVRNYLAANNIRVPEIYLDLRSEGFLLVEDVGEVSLSDKVRQLINEADSDYKNKITDTFKSTLSLLSSLQNLQSDGKCVAFQRSATFENLRSGGEEFINFILLSLNLKKGEIGVFSKLFDQLSEEVLSHKKVFSHYDFTSHNILLLPTGDLSLIDFQDAALESPARDLHAVLCDRGMDQILGKEILKDLFSYFQSITPKNFDLPRLYLEYQLIWDTRVSGRFSKLANVDGREKYREWIPGTLARVVRGLEQMVGRSQDFADGLEILLKKLAEAKDYLSDKWPVLN